SRRVVRTCAWTCFPSRCNSGQAPRTGAGTHPLRSSTACDRDAPCRVLRLAASREKDTTYGCGSAPDFDRLSPPRACWMYQPQAIPSPGIGDIPDRGAVVTLD